MRPAWLTRRIHLLGYVLLAILALAQAGCLLVAAGAAGGAAVGYAYYKGKVCQVYNASFDDAWAATHTGLAELGMPLSHEERKTNEGSIESRTADGDKVRIYVEAVPSRIPAEGMLARVCVRIATFGDQFVSDRVLDQVSAHLTPATMLNQAPAGQTPPVGMPPQPQQQPQPLPPPRLLQPVSGSQETAPPPLLPPEPSPQRVPGGR